MVVLHLSSLAAFTISIIVASTACHVKRWLQRFSMGFFRPGRRRRRGSCHQRYPAFSADGSGGWSRKTLRIAPAAAPGARRAVVTMGQRQAAAQKGGRKPSAYSRRQAVKASAWASSRTILRSCGKGTQPWMGPPSEAGRFLRAGASHASNNNRGWPAALTRRSGAFSG